MTAPWHDRLAAEYVRIHNAACAEYKAAFKAVGARLWHDDHAHALFPVHETRVAANMAMFGLAKTRTVYARAATRPLTVLDSFPAARRQRAQLDLRVDEITARYNAQWAAVLRRFR